MKSRTFSGFFVLLFVLGLALFFTNPDQGAHRSSIKNEFKKEMSIPGIIKAEIICRASTYNDFFLFSTTNYRGEAVSYGAFGKVLVNTDVTLIGERP